MQQFQARLDDGACVADRSENLKKYNLTRGPRVVVPSERPDVFYLTRGARVAVPSENSINNNSNNIHWTSVPAHELLTETIVKATVCHEFLTDR